MDVVDLGDLGSLCTSSLAWVHAVRRRLGFTVCYRLGFTVYEVGLDFAVYDLGFSSLHRSVVDLSTLIRRRLKFTAYCRLMFPCIMPLT